MRFRFFNKSLIRGTTHTIRDGHRCDNTHHLPTDSMILDITLKQYQSSKRGQSIPNYHQSWLRHPSLPHNQTVSSRRRYSSFPTNWFLAITSYWTVTKGITSSSDRSSLQRCWWQSRQYKKNITLSHIIRNFKNRPKYYYSSWQNNSVHQFWSTDHY